MTVTDINEKKFYEYMERKTKVYYVVDFYAKWCGPCKKFAPKYEKLSETYKDIRFLKVDIENNEDLAEKYDIRSLPTFLFFVSGKDKPLFSPIVGVDEEKIIDNLKYLKKKIEKEGDK